MCVLVAPALDYDWLAGCLTLLFLHSGRYEAFDFHRECRGLRWNRVHAFIDRLEPELAAIGWVMLRIRMFVVIYYCFIFQTMHL